MTATTARTTLPFCFLAALCEGFDVQTARVAAAGISRERLISYASQIFELTPGDVLVGLLRNPVIDE